MSWLGPDEVLTARALREYQEARIRLEVPATAPLRLSDFAMPNWLAVVTFIAQFGWFVVFSVMAFRTFGLSWPSLLHVVIMLVAWLGAALVYQSRGLAIAVVAGLVLSRSDPLVVGTFGFYSLVVFSKELSQWCARDRIKRLAFSSDDNLLLLLGLGLVRVLPTEWATAETQDFFRDLEAALDGDTRPSSS